MTMEEIKQSLIVKIEAARQYFASELNTIRSGRANAGLLDKVLVDIYDQKSPLRNVATITVPDPKQLLIQPWDKSNVVAVEKAILNSGLGFSVTNEGDKVRVVLPHLSSERREELVKLAARMSEEAKVSIRNARRIALETLEAKAKEGGISDDDKERSKKEFQSLIDGTAKEIDQLTDKKSEELRLM